MSVLQMTVALCTVALLTVNDTQLHKTNFSCFYIFVLGAFKGQFHSIYIFYDLYLTVSHHAYFIEQQPQVPPTAPYNYNERTRVEASEPYQEPPGESQAQLLENLQEERENLRKIYETQMAQVEDNLLTTLPYPCTHSLVLHITLMVEDKLLL